MQLRSQAMLERQLVQRELQVKEGKMSAEEAFGNLPDWTIQLEERKAFLHPNLRQWLWHDDLHDEWILTGCGIGEAILLAFQKIAGIKKLPQTGNVDQWCACYQDKKMYGPVKTEELAGKLISRSIPKNLLVWSTCANCWLKPVKSNNRIITLCDQKGKPVLCLDEQGQFVEFSFQTGSMTKVKK